jgi:hypothetical protein
MPLFSHRKVRTPRFPEILKFHLSQLARSMTDASAPDADAEAEESSVARSAQFPFILWPMTRFRLKAGHGCGPRRSITTGPFNSLCPKFTQLSNNTRNRIHRAEHVKWTKRYAFQNLGIICLSVPEYPCNANPPLPRLVHPLNNLLILLVRLGLAPEIAFLKAFPSIENSPCPMKRNIEPSPIIFQLLSLVP